MAEREPSDTLQEIREKLERYANPLPCACEENDEECYCMTMPTPPFSRDEAASLLSRLSTLEAADASDWNRLDAAEEQVATLQAERDAQTQRADECAAAYNQRVREQRASEVEWRDAVLGVERERDTAEAHLEETLAARSCAPRRARHPHLSWVGCVEGVRVPLVEFPKRRAYLRP